MHYLYLGLAVILEVVGTSFLKVAHSNPGFWPVASIVVSYALSFALLMLCLDRFPIWPCLCGLGRARNCPGSGDWRHCVWGEDRFGGPFRHWADCLWCCSS